MHEVNADSSDLPENDKIIDGETLMRDGVHPSCHNEFDSAVIVISAA